jgi:3-dehydroquinate synthase
MDTIGIRGLTGQSEILIGEAFKNLGNHLPEKDVFIITDDHVNSLYGDRFPLFPVYSVRPGEPSKSLAEAERIYSWLLDKGADRSSFILAIGGGVVLDLAGFVASTYMRGLSFGFVATTLLAQVDASVGGKNGVDFQGFKNIIGTFNQPQFVICDPELLKTLPQIELSNGLAEMVKHALIADHSKFAFMEEYAEDLLRCNSRLLTPLIVQSVKIKAAIVSEDEREKGQRKKLNLGHTWGHAVEAVTGLPHGQCVYKGLEFAARFSVARGMLSGTDYSRIGKLIDTLRFTDPGSFDVELAREAMLRDKKKHAGYIDFVLMNGIGDAVIESISIPEITDFVRSDVTNNAKKVNE